MSAVFPVAYSCPLACWRLVRGVAVEQLDSARRELAIQHQVNHRYRRPKFSGAAWEHQASDEHSPGLHLQGSLESLSGRFSSPFYIFGGRFHGSEQLSGFHARSLSKKVEDHCTGGEAEKSSN